MSANLALDYKFAVKSAADEEHLRVLSEVLKSSPNPLGIECAQNSHSFSCHLRARACTDFQLLEFKVETPPNSNSLLVAKRARSHIARNTSAQHNVVIWLGGEHEFTTGKNTYSMHAGDFAFTNNEIEFCSKMYNSGQAYNLAFPAHWDRIGDIRIEQTFGKLFSEQQRNGLSSYVKQLFKRPNALTLPGASDKLYDVLALAVNPRAASEHQTGLFALVRDFIENHYADPELTPAKVAASFGISLRYLHQLFANSDATFTNSLIAIRLEQASRILCDMRFQQRTILGIAYDCGFRDINHFGRRFKARYGFTPGECRRAAGTNANNPMQA